MKWSAIPSPNRQRIQFLKSAGASEPVIFRACQAST